MVISVDLNHTPLFFFFMYKHVLLALFLIGVPFVYAQENSEILCDIPDPTGHCYQPLTQSENANLTNTFVKITEDPTLTINFGISLFVLIGIGIGLIVVAIVIKKRKQQ